MSYPSINNEDFFADILRRKEFYSLKADPAYNYRDPGVHDPLSGKYLKIHSHQLFAKNYMSPNTKYARFHLSHVMGSGKTLAAVSIAHGFIEIYQKMYAANVAKLPLGRRNYAELDRGTPTVFVLGFGGTKSAFVRELLKYPEFGFITLTEKDELNKRRKMSEAGLPDDVKSYKEYYVMLKKRITNKSKSGFYKFFGYDEFVNRLFTSDNIKLTDLEAIAVQRLRNGESVRLEDIFHEYIQSGKIRVNYQLLAMFENSLLICDEVHNTYNMTMKNNRGVAIQFILDSVPSVRLLTISATPINNSPTEAVELVNYLIPPELKITKKGFFSNSRTLLPGKLEELGRLTRGRLSFLQDINVNYFPKKVFVGESIVLPKAVDVFPAGSSIPYLKFIKCSMSRFHQATYVNYVKEAESSSTVRDIARDNGKGDDAAHDDNDGNNDDEDVGRESKNDSPSMPEDNTIAEMYPYHRIPTDGYAIYDIVFPNPESETHGMFRSSEVRNKIAMAPQEWRDKHKIMVKKYSVLNSIITGDFLLREHVGHFSAKYKALIDILMDEIIPQAKSNPELCQKTMIYHDRVKMSGVLLIQELLRANGFIDEHSEPSESTICCVCGGRLAEHMGDDSAMAKGSHTYRPARFIIAHSDMDKALMDQSLAKFNNPNNKNGLHYMILIGSRIIRESYDFKDIRNLIIVSLPINIPTLLQVLGRCIRKNSHINLPTDLRQVDIRILISTINEDHPYVDIISPEIYRYIDKLADYMVIQKIEREFNRNAVDATIHRDIIMPPGLRREYFPPGVEGPVETLGGLYYEPMYELPSYTADKLNVTTFNAYKHYEEEIKAISYIIKRLFISSPVWSYDDLWAAVKRPPVGLEVNPGFFNESNFIIALHNLITAATPVISATPNGREGEMTESMLIERLFDRGERYIYMGGSKHKIEQVGIYYILFPMESSVASPLNVVHSEYMEHIRDKERAMIKEFTEPTDRILVDVETYLRRVHKGNGVRIGIDSFVKASKASSNYTTKRAQFISSFSDKEDISDFLIDYSEQFQMSFVEEAIVTTVLGPLAAGNNTGALKLYAKVIELLNKFKVIIYLKEVTKYRDTARQYKYGLPVLPDTTPLGYITAKSVRLFDPQVATIDTPTSRNPTENTPDNILENTPDNTPENTPDNTLENTLENTLGNTSDNASNTHVTGGSNGIAKGRWIEVSKIALNKHVSYKENEVIIGVLESAGDHMRFKLRKPVHKIKEDIAKETQLRKAIKSNVMSRINSTVEGDTTSTVYEKEGMASRTVANDTRLIERGIVCGTKNKWDLLHIIAALGISVSKMGRSEMRIRRLCDIIKDKLISNEIKERQHDGKYKYIYSWWDEMPNIVASL